MKIKRIVISQPEPKSEKSPYADVAQKYGVKIDFRKFIKVEGLSSNNFRKQKIDILNHSAVIFSTKTGVDHFFRICEEVRVTVPDTMKYFCISESIALYLQKYITYRKRKIFFSPDNTFASLIDHQIKKHRDENFLVVLPDGHKADIPKALAKANVKHTKAILYKTVSSDLSDLKLEDYDMMVFFSPNGIKSLFDNWPNFVQGDMAIGAFGPATSKAVKEAKLRLDVSAPSTKCSSMPQALDIFLGGLTRKDRNEEPEITIPAKSKAAEAKADKTKATSKKAAAATKTDKAKVAAASKAKATENKEDKTKATSKKAATATKTDKVKVAAAPKA
ncbi:MAG: uroporphyrinogen-III synthase, partial [Bacteroidales bacterium]|nr:uroporphyrinogen-III synthase [Bacteroidales bacterium]